MSTFHVGQPTPTPARMWDACYPEVVQVRLKRPCNSTMLFRAGDGAYAESPTSAHPLSGILTKVQMPKCFKCLKPLPEGPKVPKTGDVHGFFTRNRNQWWCWETILCICVLWATVSGDSTELQKQKPRPTRLSCRPRCGRRSDRGKLHEIPRACSIPKASM